jgi:hypothetical protein
MNALGKAGTLFDESVAKAREIVSAYRNEDQFQLLTNDFEGRHQRLLSKEDFLASLKEIKLSPSVHPLSQIVSRQEEVLKNPETNGSEKIIYLLSDFQKSVSDIDKIPKDTLLNINLIPVSSQKRNNAYIDSAWLSSPVIRANEPSELVVSITNASESPLENSPVKLTLNGIQKGLTSVSAAAGANVEAKIPFTPGQTGWIKAEISITDYPVTFDDNYFLAFHVAEHIDVLSLNESKESPYLKALFAADPYFNFKNASAGSIDYSSMGLNQLIILNELKSISSGMAQELSKFTTNGGTAVVFPAPEPDILSYNQFFSLMGANPFSGKVSMTDKVSQIQTEHELFLEVFENEKMKNQNLELPQVKQYFAMSALTQSNQESLLRLQGGRPFLVRYQSGKGSLYVFSVPLQQDFSNIAKHAIFVPLMYRMALLSSNKYTLSYTIGQNDFVTYNQSVSGDNVFKLKKDNGKFEMIPGHSANKSDDITTLFIRDELKENGNYVLTEASNPLAVYAFNYDRRESALETLSEESILENIEKSHNPAVSLINIGQNNFKSIISELNQGIRLWKWCLLLGLLFLAAEIILLRFWKFNPSTKTKSV